MYKKLPKVLSKETLEKLLNSIDLSTPYGVRNYCIVELIYSTGLRVSEVVSLNLGDIDFYKQIILVKGKGKKQRYVIFNDITTAWLEIYIKEVRPRLYFMPTKALFLSYCGKRLTRFGIWYNYKKIAEKINVSSKLHSLRHTFATDLLKNGADLRTIQVLLGHENITTTQIYTHIDNKYLKEAHKKYMPKLSKYFEQPSPTLLE